MMTRRKLASPYLLGLDAGYPWWLTGGLSQQFPHTAPTGEAGGGAAGGGAGGTDGEPNPDAGAGGAGGDAGASTDAATVAQMREQLSAADRKRLEAERAAQAAQAKLKEIEDKDKSELERTTERVAQLEQEKAKADEEIAKLRLENAFLAANEVEWHEPEEALMLAQTGGYLEGVIKEDGTVDKAKLKTKLAQMAEKKKHLVKTKTDAPPPGPSGAPLGSGGRTPPESGDPDSAALKQRYRTLRR